MSTLLTSLPSEVLLNICSYLTTPSFILLTSTCRTLFHLPQSSRDLLLHHLDNVPGITLGLEDKALSTCHLWLLLRQRASAHLYGANFNADCCSYAFRSGQLNPSASCISDSFGDLSISLVSQNGLEIREVNSRCSPLDKLPSPYPDGLGRVVQVVHHGHFISVLYAWQAPKDYRTYPDLPPSPTLGPLSPPARRAPPTRMPDPHSSPEHRERSRSPPSDRPRIRYHLIHYDSHGFERPTFFTIKPPKAIKYPGIKYRGRRSNDPILIPVHVAIYNRLSCAITWSESHLGQRSRNTTVVMLYITDNLPPLFEEGTYASFKVYPPRPPPLPPPPPPPPPDPDISDLTNFMRANNYEQSRKSWRSDSAYFAHHRPVATAFWHHGSHLVIYSCGRHVPFAAAVIDHSRLSDLLNVKVTRLDGVAIFPAIGPHFRFDRPFYGQHSFSPYYREGTPDTDCLQVHLRLAVLIGRRGDLVTAEEHKAMCIYQTRVALPSEECPHYFNQDAASGPFSRFDGHRVVSQHVVARLWGWEPPSDNPTTMSALDTVAISQGGTRIAISYWNKVLVWAIRPDVLCEEWDDYSATDTDVTDSGSEAGQTIVHSNMNSNMNSNTSNGAPSDTESDAGSAAEPGGHAQHTLPSPAGAQSATASVRSLNLRPRKSTLRATRFYKTTRDRKLGEIVELRPIVLHLPNGEVARKMQWRSPQQNDSDEDGNAWSEEVIESDSDSSCPAVAPSLSELDYPILDREPVRGASWRRSRPRRRSLDRQYSPTLMSDPRPDSGHGPDLDANLSLNFPASEQEGEEEGEEGHTDDGDNSSRQGGGDRSLQNQSQDAQGETVIEDVLLEPLNASKGDRPSVCKRSGSGKPSETWGMNKTMDLVVEEAEVEEEGRADDREKHKKNVNKNKQKNKQKMVTDAIEKHIPEKEDDDEDDDDDTATSYRHGGHRKLAAVERRRRRRQIKGKLPVRDPPGDHFIRTLDRYGPPLLHSHHPPHAHPTAADETYNNAADDADSQSRPDRNTMTHSSPTAIVTTREANATTEHNPHAHAPLLDDTNNTNNSNNRNNADDDHDHMDDDNDDDDNDDAPRSPPRSRSRSRSSISSSNSSSSSSRIRRRRERRREKRRERRRSSDDSNDSNASLVSEASVSGDDIWPQRRTCRRRKKKRQTEDELVVLTDRGVQVWDMGVWATGRREDAFVPDF